MSNFIGDVFCNLTKCVEVEVTLLTASDDDFIIDVQMVDVINCGIAPIMLTGELDSAFEDLEVFLLSIAENPIYGIGFHSIATVYIRGVEPSKCMKI